ncbi:MAG: hypothetical protein ACRERR_02420 [Moraxellaceae bacterium]
MKISIALKLLIFSLTTVSAGVLAAASEERPRLQDYPSSYTFLQALEAWNRAHPDGATSSAPHISLPASKKLMVVDPTSELAPPPFEITGPETLDGAVEKAREISHPDYKEKIRYHRSTHLSFPLHSIDGQDMSQASVGDTLSIKGKTEAEKKAELEKLTRLMEQDQRKLKPQETGSVDGSALPASLQNLNQGTLANGPRSHIDITVSSH